jgi:hypothetical protein
VRIPTFSRQSEPDTAERPPTAGTTTATDTTPVRPRTERERADIERDRNTTVRNDKDTTAELKPVPPPPPPARRSSDSSVTPPPPPAEIQRKPEPTPVVEERVDKKPRASMLATLSLILGVAGLLLVLSGPLMGYGIGVAGLALVLSLGGIHATGKRHVAGKSDALLGMVFSLGAIVLGVLALTGSLSWLGTDMQPVSTFREWLDSQFVNRF